MSNSSALEGLKVVDLSRLLPGPFCTMFLADFGAEVIKVESPGIGDYMREVDPVLNGEGVIHLIVNRNKKSLTLDLKSEAGKEAIHKLVAEADVVIESFRPGVVKKLGIDYESLKNINPEIVYCSLTGYGQDGPYKDLPGHDINYLGLAGIMDLNGRGGDSPVLPGAQIADMAGGMTALVSILTSLMARRNTGKGQYIDVSMLDVAFSWNIIPFAWHVFGEPITRGEGHANGGLASYDVYPTKDGRYLSVGAMEEKFWHNICKILGREDLADLHGGGAEDQEKIREELTAVLKEKNLDEWVEKLFKEDTCVSPINKIEEAAEDPQLHHRDMVIETDHPRGGKFKQIGVPFKLSDTPGEVSDPAPSVGEHTVEILKSLGYKDEEIEQFRSNNII